MKSKYLNKQETAEAFEVSLPTLNGWVRGGCPVAQRGGITKPWKFDIVALATWQANRDAKQRPALEPPPEAAKLLERWPDMVNDIRFASEYGVHSFLEFYNQRHPGVMAQLLHERGLSKLNAIAAIKDATAVMSYAFFDWIEGDRFYVDVCDGAIDDLWNTVSAHHVETTAPTDEESVLFDIPEWCKWSNEKLVEHWLKQKGEAA